MKKYKICLLMNRILNIFKIQKSDIIKITTDLPDVVDANTVYITGENEMWNYFTFKCPCGCNDNIELNLNPRYRPGWSITWHLTGTISISPSVNRIKKCRSHFFYKKGKIVWCSYNNGYIET
ncbi:DUF6527 family protein [Anaerocolumna xylanovorans]|uniref:Uncharacterized protein n=1 Tax=Anaerocolumna xylanovorans DSM 12503 TaxID=1121345 RepID=A0A1M7YLF7_9FIRM|nr:DUF6527 family protein [Anaerocolumna xylanovorans]SHO53455.1 hypothetical protein SAMN02745217_04133 [Anaerocolumna xylanovorans DSM 12503]